MLTSHTPAFPLYFWCCKQSKTGQREDTLEWAGVDYVVVRYQMLWRTIIQVHTVCCWVWNRTEKRCLPCRPAWVSEDDQCTLWLGWATEGSGTQTLYWSVHMSNWRWIDKQATLMHWPIPTRFGVVPKFATDYKTQYTYCSRFHLILLMYVSSCLTLGQQWLRVRCTI